MISLTTLCSPELVTTVAGSGRRPSAAGISTNTRSASRAGTACTRPQRRPSIAAIAPGREACSCSTAHDRGKAAAVIWLGREAPPPAQSGRGNGEFFGHYELEGPEGGREDGVEGP